MLVYPLVEGFVHQWLTLGPVDQPLDSLPQPEAAPDTPPDFDHAVELARVAVGEVEYLWDVYRAAPDHWLAWHGFLPTLTLRRAWGFVLLHSAQPQTVTLTCTRSCAASLWLNGQPLLPAPNVTLSPPQNLPAGVAKHENGEGRAVLRDAQHDTTTGLATIQVSATLRAGVNPLLLRLEAVGVRGVTLQAALRVQQTAPAAPLIRVYLPTTTTAPRRRQRLEEMYTSSRLDRAVYGKHDAIRLHAPARARNIPAQLRLQKPGGGIYAETIDTLEGGKVVESVHGSQLPNGALDAVVMAPFQQYYNEGLRARHTIPILIANQPFYTKPGVGPDEGPDGQSADARLIEALRAQIQSGESVYSELAKMAFGWWEQVSPATIDGAVARVMARAADALPDLLGLITLRARMPAYQGFPQTLLPSIDRGLTHFATHSGAGFAAWDAPDEAAQLSLLAARYLTRQLYPASDNTHAASETLATWLRARGGQGLHQWHSDHAQLVMALAPLVSLAQDDDVREGAAALLDMLALAWATHTHGGTFGASRGRAAPHSLRSGRFTPEAALTRLLWGTGGYQTGTTSMGIAAAVALALARTSYTLPDVIRAIARAQPDAAWVRERHQAANLATYRTPDYLLSSVQAHRAGERGTQEQIWQATLGPEALVFANHPARYSQAEDAAPGWWVGNDILPRVAQYHDALLARYRLPATAWLHFTHLYFPTYAFDEHTLIDRWAFARVGDGYVALWSDPAFTLVKDGPDAGRELRVAGRDAVWLCQMGRRATDGDFAAFQRKVLASAPQVADDAVTWTTARGDTLTLDDAGPLLVNGQATPLDAFPRHSSPFGHADYPAEQLDIVLGEDGLRLRFL